MQRNLASQNPTTSNMKISFILLVCLSLVSLSQSRPEPPSSMYGVPGGGYSRGGPGGFGGSSEPANYMFMYEVQDAASGNDFGHMERRMGNSATGSYHVLLPDGRMQKVDYVADDGGYMPVVSYTGEAKFGPGVGGGKTGGGRTGGGYFYRR